MWYPSSTGFISGLYLKQLKGIPAFQNVFSEYITYYLLHKEAFPGSAKEQGKRCPGPDASQSQPLQQVVKAGG